MGEVISIRMPMAVKRHHCDLCHGQIAIGDEYIAETVVDGGLIYTFKTCMTCKKMIRLYNLFEHDDEYDWTLFESRVHGLCHERGISIDGKSARELSLEIMKFDGKEEE